MENKHRTVGRSISFCPKYNWYEVKDDKYWKNDIKCPRCESWVWEVYEFCYYKNKKLVVKEAGITDNDECSLHGESLKELKRICNKAIRVISKAK